MTTYIVLPNKDRSVLEAERGSSNYTVKLSEPLRCQNCECFLVSATIPYTWYNVNEDNNSLYLPGKTVKLAPGNYTDATAFVAAVSKLLTAGEKLTLDSSTMRCTLTISNDHTLSGPLLELLGFSPTKTLTKGTHVSPNLVDVTSGVNSLLIYLSIIENTRVGSYLVPLIATVPLRNHVYGDMIYYSAYGPDYEAHSLRTNEFSTVEVDIRDTRGRKINFNNYTLEIKIGIRKRQ